MNICKIPFSAYSKSSLLFEFCSRIQDKHHALVDLCPRSVHRRYVLKSSYNQYCSIFFGTDQAQTKLQMAIFETKSALELKMLWDLDSFLTNLAARIHWLQLSFYALIQSRYINADTNLAILLVSRWLFLSILEKFGPLTGKILQMQ